MIKASIKNIIGALGYDIVSRKAQEECDKEEYAEFWDLYLQCKDYSMTKVKRMYALYKGVEYIIKNNIPGDIVECGVWRGGSTMLIAMTLLKFNSHDRNIYLYDTFEGMSEPSENDVDFKGISAETLLKDKVSKKTEPIWCYADLSDVKKNMESTGYPSSNIFYIKGKVENTIPQNNPKNSIALLRLDTDWYESTYHEMVHLFPLLVSKGVLIIDDYGHWQGARKAIDNYFDENKTAILLNRIDHTGRIAIKF